MRLVDHEINTEDRKKMKDKSAQYKDKIIELYQDPKDADVVMS
jgi:hypothetical protein